MPFARLIALVAAIVAWAALGLQLWLVVDKMTGEGFSVAAAIWRFLGFFTILTNLAVAVVAAAMALAPETLLARPRLRFAVAVAIVIVGVVYSVALRHIWNPEGWQAVADHALHDVTPPLFLLAWIIGGRGKLAWRDALWALPWPTAYCLYALARGAADGWYAYWFLDPSALSFGQLAVNVALLVAGFLLVGLSMIALDRAMRAIGR